MKVVAPFFLEPKQGEGFEFGALSKQTNKRQAKETSPAGQRSGDKRAVQTSRRDGTVEDKKNNKNTHKQTNKQTENATIVALSLTSY